MQQTSRFKKTKTFYFKTQTEMFVKLKILLFLLMHCIIKEHCLFLTFFPSAGWSHFCGLVFRLLTERN